MKTLHLSDDAYAEIAAALEEKGMGQGVVIGVLSARHGPDSDDVRTEKAKLAGLTRAAHEFYGWSTWRSNGGKSLPAGSVFAPGDHA